MRAGEWHDAVPNLAPQMNDRATQAYSVAHPAESTLLLAATAIEAIRAALP